MVRYIQGVASSWDRSIVGELSILSENVLSRYRCSVLSDDNIHYFFYLLELNILKTVGV